MSYRELLSLVDQLLFELLLGLGLQELLPEGDVREHRGKCSAELDGRLGAFLKRMMRKLKFILIEGWEKFTFKRLKAVRFWHFSFFKKAVAD